MRSISDSGHHTAFSSSFSKVRGKTKQEADNHTPHPHQILKYLQMTATRMKESEIMSVCVPAVPSTV